MSRLPFLALLLQLSLQHAPIETIFIRMMSLAGQLFHQNTLFDRQTRSLIDCASLCSTIPACLLFNFTSLQGMTSICRGHSVPMTPSSGGQPSPTSVTFFLVSEPEFITQSPETTSLSSYTSHCISNSTCTMLHSMCYLGKCLCTPGYYFSPSKNTCVSSCAQNDLGSQFTLYREGNIASNTISSKKGIDSAGCLSLCMTIPNCRSIDFRHSDQTCFPMSNTALQSQWRPLSSHNHYQRYCL